LSADTARDTEDAFQDLKKRYEKSNGRGILKKLDMFRKIVSRNECTTD
jgi:hypothetical protein